MFRKLANLPADALLFCRGCLGIKIAKVTAQEAWRAWMHNDGQPCSGGLPRESTMTWWIWQGLQRIGHSHPSPSPRTSLHGQPVPTCPNPPGYQGIFQYQRCSSQLSKSLREELPDTPPWKIGATPGHLPTRCLFILFLRGSCWKRASVDVVQGTVPGTTEA